MKLSPGVPVSSELAVASTVCTTLQIEANRTSHVIITEDVGGWLLVTQAGCGRAVWGRLSMGTIEIDDKAIHAASHCPTGVCATCCTRCDQPRATSPVITTILNDPLSNGMDQSHILSAKSQCMCEHTQVNSV